MSRKNKKNKNILPAAAGEALSGKGIPTRDEGGITKKGAYILGISVIIITAGYISLSNAAPDGRDIWSNLAAFLLIAGYLLIPFGIMSRGSQKSSSPS